MRLWSQRRLRPTVEVMGTSATTEGVRVLSRALDQTGDVLDHVHAGHLDAPTPCADWNVAALVDHLVATPVNFLTMLRGEQPDWAAPPPHIAGGWPAEFRSHADDLIHAWHQVEAAGAPTTMPPEWQVAELAVHTWDLARAIGFPVARLDPEVAATGLAFMRGALRPEVRGDAFGPERPAPPDAGPYDALAAFAGRSV
jgi:uncharacterized protein (TIGR03086 family)